MKTNFTLDHKPIGFGPHLHLDLNQCSAHKLASLDVCRKLLFDLPEEIGMTKITAPNVFWYKPEHKMEHGITGMVIIAESHISIHTYPFLENPFAFVDVFSCKPFDVPSTINFVVRSLGCEDPDWDVSWRGAKFPIHQVASVAAHESIKL